MRTRIKFCGFTGVDEVQSAVELGIDAVGVIFAPASPRRVTPSVGLRIAAALPAFVSLVGVFVDPTPADLDAAGTAGFLPQFCGDELPALCERARGSYIKVFHLAPDALDDASSARFAQSALSYPHATWMFDTAVDGKRGGTGRTFDWNLVRTIGGDRRLIVSGGLTPQNVGDCVRKVRPFGVDVRSGIETDGVKDPVKMRAFVRAVKEADAQT